MKIKKIAIICFLSLIIFAQGCLKFQMKTQINQNGSGERQLVIAIDKQISPYIGDQFNKGLPSFIKIKKYTQADKVNYTVNLSFEDIKDLQQKLAKLSSNDNRLSSSTKVTLVKKDYLVVAYYDFKESFPAPKKLSAKINPLFKNPANGLEPLTGIFGSSVPGFEDLNNLSLTKMKYSLKLPGRFILDKTNTHRFENGSAVWLISSEKGQVVKANSVMIRWWLLIILILLALFILFVFIFFAVSFFLIRRDKKKA